MWQLFWIFEIMRFHASIRSRVPDMERCLIMYVSDSRWREGRKWVDGCKWWRGGRAVTFMLQRFPYPHVFPALNELFQMIIFCILSFCLTSQNLWSENLLMLTQVQHEMQNTFILDLSQRAISSNPITNCVLSLRSLIY